MGQLDRNRVILLFQYLSDNESKRIRMRDRLVQSTQLDVSARASLVVGATVTLVLEL